MHFEIFIWPIFLECKHHFVGFYLVMHESNYILTFFSSDRMTGHSGVVPIWVASQDAENFDATNYVKMTKPLEKDASKMPHEFLCDT